ncbi:MAG: hypothetical protein QOF71_3182 [Candidatus Eremiobacteraeota bacterium]|nr:hypothetical protein [Candidatus Eremiobacteraeota bacterium]
MRKPYPLLVVAAALAMSACSGGSGSSTMPATGLPSAGSPQTVTRAALGNKKASPGSYVLWGDATLVSPGHNSPTAAQASTNASTTYGGVDFGAPVASISQLNTLSTDVQLVSGTNGTCAAGSPRYSIDIGQGTTYLGSLFINIPCGAPGTWSNTGNVICSTCIVYPSGGICALSSQPNACISGETYAQAQADYGSYTLLDVYTVVDPSNGAQVVNFDNSQVNNQVFTYETADSCKKGGWQQFTGPPGPFKNQGDCVSYFNNGK